ncbi:response regulator (plasmid) [Ensifer adhaerens]|uniref:response regulator n=1 Tax=Ensifer adhaerens TaxID=106592 RepID=UPI001CBD9996|nr:response regulator [Ensifer adhaerens]MBZ7927666.1 response regulator [Ensifer adhaerens]UAX98062.1 response regulator [Ensifer adhaerens]UAY05443.1 response regulator [Ensifer adhaerens]UAY12821.1 response regulator [Ensifer adhaerens]
MAMGTDNGGQVLQGAKILVLEDEFFIALDVEAAMQTAGADVVGPFADLPQALAAASREDLSLAVLDIRLVSTTTKPVCDLLTERKIPFFFYSGQPLPDDMAVKYGKVPFVDKPARMDELVEAATLLLRAGRNKSELLA